jgi:hypothetical protein
MNRGVGNPWKRQTFFVSALSSEIACVSEPECENGMSSISSMAGICASRDWPR